MTTQTTRETMHMYVSAAFQLSPPAMSLLDTALAYLSRTEGDQLDQEQGKRILRMVFHKDIPVGQDGFEAVHGEYKLECRFTRMNNQVQWTMTLKIDEQIFSSTTWTQA